MNEYVLLLLQKQCLYFEPIRAEENDKSRFLLKRNERLPYDYCT